MAGGLRGVAEHRRRLARVALDVPESDPPVVGVADRVEIPLTVERADTPTRVPEPASATAPTTTIEQNRHSLGQRRVNLIWEGTQAFVATAVTTSTLYVAANLALRDDKQAAAFLLLSNAFFLVVGFYFGRTNHQRVGGVDLGR